MSRRGGGGGGGRGGTLQIIQVVRLTDVVIQATVRILWNTPALIHLQWIGSTNTYLRGLLSCQTAIFQAPQNTTFGFRPYRIILATSSKIEQIEHLNEHLNILETIFPQLS